MTSESASSQNEDHSISERTTAQDEFIRKQIANQFAKGQKAVWYFAESSKGPLECLRLEANDLEDAIKKLSMLGVFVVQPDTELRVHLRDV